MTRHHDLALPNVTYHDSEFSDASFSNPKFGLASSFFCRAAGLANGAGITNFVGAANGAGVTDCPNRATTVTGVEGAAKRAAGVTGITGAACVTGIAGVAGVELVVAPISEL